MTTMDTDNVVAVEEEDPYPFDIYISARTGDDFVYRWFVINDHTQPKEFLCHVISDLQPNYKFASSGACVVALGSSIYVIGGYDLFSYRNLDPFKASTFPADGFITNEVYRIDTLHPDHGWTQCSPMAKKRCGARAFTHNGKIYVVGGFDLPRIYKTTDDVDVPSQSPSQHNNYIEVFNPKEGEWKPAFSSIPDDYLINHYIDACYVRDKPSGGGGAIEAFVRILGFSGTEKLYKYDSDDQSWTLHANDFGPYSCRSLVFADDILYSYDNHPAFETKHTEASKVAEGSILCFDVNRPEAEPKQLKGLENFLPTPDPNYKKFYPVATLRHLGCGTKFCLIWEQALYLTSENATIPERVQGPGGGSLTAVHCLKFTVSKVSSEKQGEFDFHGTQPSKSTYFMEAEVVDHITAFPWGAECVEEGTCVEGGSSDNSIRIKRVKTV